MKWGLVLSGGAACGLANAGVLSVFEKEGLEPDYIAGSSMGAIIGALYALGYRTQTLLELNNKLHLSKLARINLKPLRGGIHNGVFQQNIQDQLGELVGESRIADCKIPFVCVAGWMKQPIPWQRIARTGFTDSITPMVEPHIFSSETSILEAIMASSAIPVVFSPVTIAGRQYIDLCHFGAIPSRSLRKIHNPDVVIATDTTPRFSSVRKILPPAWNEFLLRGYESVEESRAACDLVIRPKQAAPLFRFDKGLDFFAAGEQAARDALPAVHRLLKG